MKNVSAEFEINQIYYCLEMQLKKNIKNIHINMKNGYIFILGINEKGERIQNIIQPRAITDIDVFSSPSKQFYNEKPKFKKVGLINKVKGLISNESGE